jgi:hypothetical protein
MSAQTVPRSNSDRLAQVGQRLAQIMPRRFVGHIGPQQRGQHVAAGMTTRE